MKKAFCIFLITVFFLLSGCAKQPVELEDVISSETATDSIRSGLSQNTSVSSEISDVDCTIHRNSMTINFYYADWITSSMLTDETFDIWLEYAFEIGSLWQSNILKLEDALAEDNPNAYLTGPIYMTINFCNYDGSEVFYSSPHAIYTSSDAYGEP